MRSAQPYSPSPTTAAGGQDRARPAASVESSALEMTVSSKAGSAVAVETPDLGLEVSAAEMGWDGHTRVGRAANALDAKLPGWLDPRVVQALNGSPLVGALPGGPRNAPWLKTRFLDGLPEIGDCLRFANALARKVGSVDPVMLEEAFLVAFQRKSRGSMKGLAADFEIDPYPYPINMQDQALRPLVLDPRTNASFVTSLLRSLDSPPTMPGVAAHVWGEIDRIQEEIKAFGKSLQTAGDPTGVKVRGRAGTGYIPSILSGALASAEHTSIACYVMGHCFRYRLLNPSEHHEGLSSDLNEAISQRVHRVGKQVVEGLLIYRDKMLHFAEEFPAAEEPFKRHAVALEALAKQVPRECAEEAKRSIRGALRRESPGEAAGEGS